MNERTKGRIGEWTIQFWCGCKFIAKIFADVLFLLSLPSSSKSFALCHVRSSTRSHARRFADSSFRPR